MEKLGCTFMGEAKLDGKYYYEPELSSQLALEAVGIYTFRLFPQDNLLMFSDLFVQKFYTKKFYRDYKNKLSYGGINEADIHKLEESFGQIEQGKKRVSTKIRGIKEESYFEITMSALECDANGAATVVVGIIRNLEDSIRQEELINALGNDFESIFYVDLDTDECVTVRASKAITEYMGEDLDRGLGYSELMSMYIDTSVAQADKETMKRETSVDNLRLQLASKSAYHFDYRIDGGGVIKHYRVKFVNMQDSKEVRRIVIGCEDINSEKQKEFERMAYIDNLTGGDNYASFKRKLRASDCQGYMISMDVHSFKIVNTICGITKGDDTLRNIWECISNLLGENDIAGHINADRFVLFFATEDKLVVRKKLSILREELQLLSYTIEIPVIIPYFGVSKWDKARRIEEVYGEANFAKNQIKDRKDSICQFYSMSDTEKMLEEKAMEDSFMEDLADGRFEVWYQPKYNPLTEQMIGAEGLVRWRKEDGTLISPGKFIPLFERDGLIKILDEYVFMQVCQQQMKWKKEGREIVPISINLSRASLYYETVVSDYRMIADEVGIDTSYIPIEITESAAIDNKNIKAIAENFHTNGFDVQIDDFGAGYSSLATLNMKCFDVLKIDKSLIDYIGDYSGECLLEHTVALAKQLGLYVTAEGVETMEQVHFLKGIDCDSIQGYYYAKPMPAEEYQNYILH